MEKVSVIIKGNLIAKGYIDINKEGGGISSSKC
ncbi:hypothetical protein [uncultured phage cr106_1]|uniref:Uncharacterized protein n=1 Tax=uncultured phage cr106_1 TaxID=2772062 RepID=A0A7M1RV13_9CAUD|nr:hypothetical protein KNV29_gp011 [uncultured phage cr106_1]QOR58265.1 hypothetical protein [uncultured phage cr106_1]